MAISMNYTSFASKGADIRIAMAHVLKTGESVRLLNRNKKAFLLVTLHKDALGYRFAFIDTDGREVGDMILTACIRTWSDLDSLSFWSLQAESYDLTEHPLVTIAREEHVKRLAWERKELLKSQGVTHTAKTYGGYEFSVAFQRDWLGRRRMYSLDSDGVFRKVSREAFLMVAKVEVLA